jgi:anthranilate phosphoribosyltransferase
LTNFEKNMRSILLGKKSEKEIITFLEDINHSGLTAEQVKIGVDIMRENMAGVKIPDAMDIVGTGGTGLKTLSISTAVSIVSASAGARVAKHGNRAASSLTGTADTLSHLGVNLNVKPEKIIECVEKCGVGFLFAPNHHPAMRFVASARKIMGKRTIFNLLGPMSNPARTKKMLVGVCDDDWRKLMSEAFNGLNAQHVWVVHGHDGLDEITTTGLTNVSEVKDGEIRNFTLDPREFGIKIVDLDKLKGGNPDKNANALMNLLDGIKDPYRDIVRLNAGVSLMISGISDNIETGIKIATDCIDSGAAKDTLQKLVTISNE